MPLIEFLNVNSLLIALTNEISIADKSKFAGIKSTPSFLKAK